MVLVHRTEAQIVHVQTRPKIEQILQYYHSFKDPSQKIIASDAHFGGKCGLGISAALHAHWNSLTTLQKFEIQEILQNAPSQKSRVIGRFRIIYDTSGSYEPALLDSTYQRIPNTAEAYVDSVGRIFNEVYQVEVVELGYEKPPFESPLDPHYRVLISDLSMYPGKNYGVTDWDPTILPLNPGSNAPRYPCFVNIQKDFSDFYTHGMNALKVTAAHEFHHVIQIGSYGLFDLNNYRYVHELTSTWLEDVVYTDVNDYYNYLPDYFKQFSDGRSFNSNSYDGYERCIWAHFIAKQLDTNVMRKVWEGMRTRADQASAEVFLESSDAVLATMGTTFQTAFAEFTKWNYFTADRSDTVKYYSEGNHYPRFQPLQKIDFYNTTSTTNGNVQPLSSSMYEFDTSNDTITAIIANVDIGNAMLKNTTQQKVDATLSSQSLSSPYQEFANGLKAKITVDNLSLWHSFFVQSSTRTDVTRLQLNAAPNPFRLAEAPWLKLPINQDRATTAEVFFFTSSFRLVYSGSLSVENKDGLRAIVVPTPEVKSKLSSGIYFIIAKTTNSDYKWKVAVIR